MNENLYQQLLLLPEYFRGHFLLTLSALAMGIAVSIPFGVWAAQSRRVRQPLLTLVNIIQTVPSLAILALIVALLGGRIGFVPAFIALTLYSMLPIVRNTVSGLESVSKDVIEAAKGMGMSPRQILTQVKLPLALPIIIAGIRTAAVWTVGLATLSTLVGATSFGNYIFSGLQTRNLVAVTIGSLASAALALALDALIGGVQWLATQNASSVSSHHRSKVQIFVLSALLGFAAVAVYGLSIDKESDFIVGGKPFTEQYVIAGLLTAELEEAGYRVEQRLGMGSDVVFEATRAGSVDIYLEYSGTIWASIMNRQDNPGRDGINRSVMAYLQDQGIVSVGPSGFENRYALAMRRDRARELGVQSIEDLIPIARTLTAGGDLEFFSRSEWPRLRDLYNIDFAEKLTFDAALMYTAVNEAQVDLITAYTTDGRVADFDLLILEDPRNAMLPYDGIYLASKSAAAQEGFRQVLAPIADAISDQLMRDANRLVDVEGRPVSDAVEFLRQELGLK